MNLIVSISEIEIAGSDYCFERDVSFTRDFILSASFFPSNRFFVPIIEDLLESSLIFLLKLILGLTRVVSYPYTHPSTHHAHLDITEKS